MSKPLLLVDVDGVISLYGFDPATRPEGRWHNVEGIPHYISGAAGEHLRALSAHFELAWCTGWEEKANEYLPAALGLTGELTHLRLGSVDRAHWKLAAIDSFAGPERPLAWIDDAHDERCRAWATARPGPTLLVGTDPAIGLTASHVETLVRWAPQLWLDDLSRDMRDLDRPPPTRPPAGGHSGAGGERIDGR